MNGKASMKLRSQSGASISFALLLFLVCAVVCSIVLTSATASSGRMSRIAEVDQRYYSVTSACELLKDAIDGTTATIVEVKKYKESESEDTTSAEKNVYLFEKPAEEEIAESDYTESNIIQDSKGNSLNSSLIGSTIQKKAIYEYYTKTDSALSKKRSLTLKADTGYPMLETVIDEELDLTSGDLNYLVGNSSTDGKAYKVKMIFKADVDVQDTYKTVSEPKETSPEGGGTPDLDGDTSDEGASAEPEENIINYIIKTTTTSITWHFDSIANVVGT